MIKENEYHNILFADHIRKQLDSTGAAIGYTGRINFYCDTLEETVTTLAKTHPTWRLIITRGWVREIYKCDAVDVLIDGEEVGTLDGVFVRGNYGVRITAPRLKTAVRTSNTKRAVSACRKAFVKRNTAERIQLAENAALSVVENLRYQTERTISGFKSEINGYAFKYAMQQVREQFVSQLLDKERETIRKYDETSLHMATITEVNDALKNNKTALVVRDGDRYIVKVGDDVALYATAELPQDLRSKVGMLKLCEDGQMVDHVGCRVSEEVFVVIVKEGASNE